MICAVYLRKSRADLEAEARGEGETLARHEHTLLELARARKLSVIGTYRELVSGDTISDRPEMRRLLSAVERGEYDAVLCMDIDRLGRGDGSDQAVILKTFKYSNTIIITPYKTYDPRAEIDEEFLEYAQFMARGEYKRIKRRMWAGRVASAKEGKWQSPKAPFGYRRQRIENGKGWTLVIEPAEAEAVREMFRRYAEGQEGKQTIAISLNAMGFRTQSGAMFTYSSVFTMLSNPVYIGKVRWAYRRKHIEMRDGVEVETRPRSDECIIADGLHPAIVDEETWETVQNRLRQQQEAHPPKSRTIRNPLAGLLYCGCCGKAMVWVDEYNRNIAGTYRCRTHKCPSASTAVENVYGIVINTLRKWVEIEPDTAGAERKSNADSARSACEAQIAQLKRQLSRLQDFLETGVYSPETYLERSKLITDRIAAAEAEIARIEVETKKDPTAAIAALRPKIQNVLDIWDSPDVPVAQKNALLRMVVKKIIYHKTTRGGRYQLPQQAPTLEIYPNV